MRILREILTDADNQLRSMTEAYWAIDAELLEKQTSFKKIASNNQSFSLSMLNPFTSNPFSTLETAYNSGRKPLEPEGEVSEELRDFYRAILMRHKLRAAFKEKMALEIKVLFEFNVPSEQKQEAAKFIKALLNSPERFKQYMPDFLELVKLYLVSETYQPAVETLIDHYFELFPYEHQDQRNKPIKHQLYQLRNIKQAFVEARTSAALNFDVMFSTRSTEYAGYSKTCMQAIVSAVSDLSNSIFTTKTGHLTKLDSWLSSSGIYSEDVTDEQLLIKAQMRNDFNEALQHAAIGSARCAMDSLLRPIAPEGLKAALNKLKAIPVLGGYLLKKPSVKKAFLVELSSVLAEYVEQLQSIPEMRAFLEGEWLQLFGMDLRQDCLVLDDNGFAPSSIASIVAGKVKALLEVGSPDAEEMEQRFSAADGMAISYFGSIKIDRRVVKDVINYLVKRANQGNADAQTKLSRLKEFHHVFQIKRNNSRSANDLCVGILGDNDFVYSLGFSLLGQGAVLSEFFVQPEFINIYLEQITSQAPYVTGETEYLYSKGAAALIKAMFSCFMAAANEEGTVHYTTEMLDDLLDLYHRFYVPFYEYDQPDEQNPLLDILAKQGLEAVLNFKKVPQGVASVADFVSLARQVKLSEEKVESCLASLESKLTAEAGVIPVDEPDLRAVSDQVLLFPEGVVAGFKARCDAIKAVVPPRSDFINRFNFAIGKMKIIDERVNVSSAKLKAAAWNGMMISATELTGKLNEGVRLTAAYMQEMESFFAGDQNTFAVAGPSTETSLLFFTEAEVTNLQLRVDTLMANVPKKHPLHAQLKAIRAVFSVVSEYGDVDRAEFAKRQWEALLADSASFVKQRVAADRAIDAVLQLSLSNAHIHHQSMKVQQFFIQVNQHIGLPCLGAKFKSLWLHASPGMRGLLQGWVNDIKQRSDDLNKPNFHVDTLHRLVNDDHFALTEVDAGDLQARIADLSDLLAEEGCDELDKVKELEQLYWLADGESKLALMRKLLDCAQNDATCLVTMSLLNKVFGGVEGLCEFALQHAAEQGREQIEAKVKIVRANALVMKFEKQLEKNLASEQGLKLVEQSLYGSRESLRKFNLIFGASDKFKTRFGDALESIKQAEGFHTDNDFVEPFVEMINEASVAMESEQFDLALGRLGLAMSTYDKAVKIASSMFYSQLTPEQEIRFAITLLDTLQNEDAHAEVAGQLATQFFGSVDALARFYLASITNKKYEALESQVDVDVLMNSDEGQQSCAGSNRSLNDTLTSVDSVGIDGEEQSPQLAQETRVVEFVVRRLLQAKVSAQVSVGFHQAQPGQVQRDRAAALRENLQDFMDAYEEKANTHGAQLCRAINAQLDRYLPGNTPATPTLQVR